MQNPLGVLHAFVQTHTQTNGEIQRDDDDGEYFNILDKLVTSDTLCGLESLITSDSIFFRLLSCVSL